MAVNMSKSMNEGLHDGLSDGKYRKARPNTSVGTDTGSAIMMKDRKGLHPWYNYGYATEEMPPMDRALPGIS